MKSQVPNSEYITHTSFQLETFPVCFWHQEKAVERILFVAVEKVPGLKHTVWARCRKNYKDFIGQ